MAFRRSAKHRSCHHPWSGQICHYRQAWQSSPSHQLSLPIQHDLIQVVVNGQDLVFDFLPNMVDTCFRLITQVLKDRRQWTLILGLQACLSMISSAKPCSLIDFGVSRKCLTICIVQSVSPCMSASTSANCSCGTGLPASSWKGFGLGPSRNKLGSSCIVADCSMDASFFCLGLLTLALCFVWALRAMYCCCSSVTRRTCVLAWMQLPSMSPRDCCFSGLVVLDFVQLCQWPSALFLVHVVLWHPLWWGVVRVGLLQIPCHLPLMLGVSPVWCRKKSCSWTSSCIGKSHWIWRWLAIVEQGSGSTGVLAVLWNRSPLTAAPEG